MRRIRQRSENIEDCADTELLADRADIFHGRVVKLSEEETEIDLL